MKQWKVVVLMLAMWLCIVLYMTNSVPSGLDAASRTERTLSRALEDLDKLYEQNRKLETMIYQLRNNETLLHGPQDNAVQNLESRLNKASSDLFQIAGSSQYPLTYEGEHARRKAENTAKELWYFLGSQLNILNKENKDDQWSAKITKLKEDLEGYRRTMLEDFNQLQKINKGVENRLQRSKELGDLVQRRLEYLQNPVDCKTAKKAYCNLQKGCGFGCQLHHLTFCLIAAYALERTLILDSNGWRYSPKGWETVFEPLSMTCSTKDVDGTQNFLRFTLEDMKETDTIYLPIVDNLQPQPDFMPLSVPADLAHELSTFHGDPAVWWIGQIVHYLFRLRPEILLNVVNAGKEMGFKSRIVGVHVRRTDKIDLEASFHSLGEYMIHVKEYYDQLERTQPNITRRIYLASDDPNVLTEARKQYPNYTFISDSSISQSASLGTRYSDSSLRGVIIDIYYLARCDFLVCTFSSQICRVAYEIMQTLHGDASNYFRSLDDIFYYGGQNTHDYVAVEANHGSSQGLLDMLPGDKIGVAGNHWNGFSKGVNHRTGQSGLFPSYKIQDSYVPVLMPTYPKVPLKRSS